MKHGLRLYLQNLLFRPNRRFAHVLQGGHNARSLCNRSFHQPFCAEKVEFMKISLTGVISRAQGYRCAKARAYAANNSGQSGF